MKETWVLLVLVAILIFPFWLGFLGMACRIWKDDL